MYNIVVNILKRNNQHKMKTCITKNIYFVYCFCLDPSVDGKSPDVLQKKRVHIVSYEYCKQIWLSETEGDGPFPTDVVCIATEGPSSPTCLVRDCTVHFKVFT
jgi:hypothetical protein